MVAAHKSSNKSVVKSKTSTGKLKLKDNAKKRNVRGLGTEIRKLLTDFIDMRSANAAKTITLLHELIAELSAFKIDLQSQEQIKKTESKIKKLQQSLINNNDDTANVLIKKENAKKQIILSNF
jgi:ribosomal protein S15P/S13E